MPEQQQRTSTHVRTHRFARGGRWRRQGHVRRGRGAAARVFYSKVLQAMDAEPDEALAATNGLVDLIELGPPSRD